MMKIRAILSIALAAGLSGPAMGEMEILLDDFEQVQASPWGCLAGGEMTSVAGGKVGRCARLRLGAGGEVPLVKPIDVPREMRTLRLWVKASANSPLRLTPVFKDRQGFLWRASERSLKGDGWRQLEFDCRAGKLRGDWRLNWWKNAEQKRKDKSGFVWEMTFPMQLIGFQVAGGEGEHREWVHLDELTLLADRDEPWVSLARPVMTVPGGGQVIVDVHAAGEPVEGTLAVRIGDRYGRELGDRRVTPFRVSVPSGGRQRVATGLTLDRPGIYQLQFAANGLGDAQERTARVISKLSGVEAFNTFAGPQAFARRPHQAEIPPTPVKLNRPLWREDDRPEMLMYVSELSPAWLLRNNATRTYHLFADTDRWGLGAPTHIALPADGRAKVRRAGAAISSADLSAMDRSWMLVWFAGAKGYDDWDVPYLVVLQHRPTAARLDEQGLKLEFDQPGGYLAVLPLYGGYKPPQAGKAHFVAQGLAPKGVLPFTWSQGLPAEVVKRCDFWARVTKAYPVNCDEQFRVDPSTDEVIIRSRFTYLTIEDDWNTEPLKYAPIPPVLANCHWGGTFPVTFDQEVHDPNYPTCYGPWMGVRGADGYTTRMKVLQYVHEVERIELPDAPSPLVGRALAELTDYAADNAADPAVLNKHIDHNVVWGMYNHYRWQNSNLLYVTDEGVQTGGKLINQYRFANEVFWKGQYKATDVGVGREFYFLPAPGWGFQGDAGKITNDAYYTAWLYAYATGDYQLIADRWDELIRRLNCLPFTMCWSRFGRDAIAEGGDEAPPPMGMARVAWAIGDMDTYAYACYLFARELTHHYVKVGVGADYFRQYQPIHARINADWKGPSHWPEHDRPIPPRVNVTNMWSESAGWILGGPPADRPIYGDYWTAPHPIHGKPPAKLPDVIPWAYYGSGQWVPKWARFDAEDVFRFYHDHHRDACREELDTWQRVEFPTLPSKAYSKPGGHGGYPRSPWRLMQLRADILHESDETIASLYPPEHWVEAEQTFYQGMARSGMSRETVRIIPRSAPATPFQRGLERDCVANPSWDNPVQTPAGIVVTDKGKVTAVHWPAPCQYMALPPRVPGDAGTGKRWSLGYITPGADRPRSVEKQPVNWVLDRYVFEGL